MKTKRVFLSLLALSATLWGTWSVAYQCGYSQGSRDEFACWKQVPTTKKEHRVMTARRDSWLLPGGKPLPAARLIYHHSVYQRINEIPSTVFQ